MEDATLLLAFIVSSGTLLMLACLVQASPLTPGTVNRVSLLVGGAGGGAELRGEGTKLELCPDWDSCAKPWFGTPGGSCPEWAMAVWFVKEKMLDEPSSVQLHG